MWITSKHSPLVFCVDIDGCAIRLQISSSSQACQFSISAQELPFKLTLAHSRAQFAKAPEGVTNSGGRSANAAARSEAVT